MVNTNTNVIQQKQQHVNATKAMDELVKDATVLCNLYRQPIAFTHIRIHIIVKAAGVAVIKLIASVTKSYFVENMSGKKQQKQKFICQMF